jgi:hypothetical protein
MNDFRGVPPALYISNHSRRRLCRPFLVFSDADSLKSFRKCEWRCAVAAEPGVRGSLCIEPDLRIYVCAG